MILRDFQLAAVDSVLSAFDDGKRTCLITLPTGTGKTVVFCHIAKAMLAKGRVLILAHREELIEQAAEKIQAVIGIKPDIEMGLRWAMERSRFLDPAQVVVSSVQTQVRDKRRHRFDPSKFSLVIVDESHHAPAKSYRKVIDYYRSNPDCHLLGVTATPDRCDKMALGSVFEHVAFDYEIEQAIEDGWLVPIQQQYIVCTDLDFSGMHKVAGDLNVEELSQLMEREKSLHAMVDPTIRIVGERKTIFFAVSVMQAERTAEIFNRHREGMARCVFVKTPTDERREIFADYATGRFQVLVNVGVATEGFDCPGIEVVAVGRPTMSRALYAQMIGRGTRPVTGLVDPIEASDARRAAILASAKPSLLVLDFVGNSGKHKLVSTLDILGGKMPDDVCEWCRKNQEQSGTAFDVTEEMKRAKREKEDRERAQADKRAALMARADYAARSVNPFRSYDRFNSQAKPRYWYFKPASDKQKAVLARYKVDSTNMTIAQASTAIDEIAKKHNWKPRAASQ